MSSTSKPVLSADGAPVPTRWVEDLFARLSAIVGNTAMGTVYGDADLERVKAEWAEALASFTPDEVRLGLASVRLRKFAPNLPEFLHLCRPSLDPEVAWHEACDCIRAKGRAAWSHPAVYWAACAMGYELRNGTYAANRKRWDALMAQQWQRGQLEPIPLAIAQAAPLRGRAQGDLPGVTRSKDEVTSMLRGVSERIRVRNPSLAVPKSIERDQPDTVPLEPVQRLHQPGEEGGAAALIAMAQKRTAVSQ